MNLLNKSIRSIDLIPWPVVVLAGIIGFLTLVRYLHIQTGEFTG